MVQCGAISVSIGTAQYWYFSQVQRALPDFLRQIFDIARKFNRASQFLCQARNYRMPIFCAKALRKQFKMLGKNTCVFPDFFFAPRGKLYRLTLFQVRCKEKKRSSPILSSKKPFFFFFWKSARKALMAPLNSPCALNWRTFSTSFQASQKTVCAPHQNQSALCTYNWTVCITAVCTYNWTGEIAIVWKMNVFGSSVA